MQIEDLKSYSIIKKITEIDSSAFVVGGYIRDLLKGQESMDIDIVTGSDIEKLATSIAKDMTATLVAFKKAGIIRVVSDSITLDFSEIQGSIYEDLSKRDFTMNAIAWSPSEGIVDPCGGVTDIKKGIIRAISEENLKSDPLRLLRAYRFIAEEGFKIDPETRRMIRRLRKRIRISASERITSELFRILNSWNYSRALKEAFADGLLGEVLSIDRDRLFDNIKSLSKMERFIESVKDSLDLALDNVYSQGLTYRGLLRLERLLMDSRFDRNRLTLSRSIWKRLRALTAAFRIYKKKRDSINSKILFEIFYELKEASIDFSILTNKKRIFLDACRFLRMKDIIPGDKIAELTGLKAEDIGKLLKKLRFLQFAGAGTPKNL